MSDLLKSLLFIGSGLGLLFVLFRIIFKNQVNAGIATTFTAIMYLFFGNIKDTMSRIPVIEFLSSYRVLLPLIVIIGAYLLIRLYKSRSLWNVNLFLNILLIIYGIIETGRLIALPASTPVSVIHDRLSLTQVPASAKSPDIYYIVPDCYPSTSWQKEVLGISGNELDSVLTAKGFRVISNSLSNYKYTAFSMASVFNMEYLGWVENGFHLRPYHYNRATEMVENAAVFNWLEKNGYDLFNLSVFDISAHPSVKKERFLTTTGTEIIFYNTLYKCLRRDVIPALFPYLREEFILTQQQNNQVLLGGFKTYNEQMLDSLAKLASINDTLVPSFVYAHLEMPHFPYFFDSSGHAYPEKDVFGPDMIRSKERFKNYIGYTNKRIGALADSILSSTNGKAIVVIQSDHGLNDIPGSKKNDAFRNYTAIYFPDREYQIIPDTMSNVNTFRIIFNKYFGQRLPLLPDSTIYNK